MRPHIYFALSCFSILIATSAYGIGKGSVSEYTEEFMDTGKAATQMIASVQNFVVTDKDFKQVVETTKIEFTDDKLISPQGIEVDALNFPSKKLIRVNHTRWYGYYLATENRLRLVIHEYLGILKVDDSKYYWSQYLMKGGAVQDTVDCDYQLAGSNYYLKINTIGGTGANHPSRFELFSGEGTSSEPKTTESASVTSLNFKISDLILGRFENLAKWNIGVSWHAKGRYLNARFPMLQMSDPGNFTVTAYDITTFVNGVINPQVITNLSCKTTKKE